jgi:hypothetical protein
MLKQYKARRTNSLGESEYTFVIDFNRTEAKKQLARYGFKVSSIKDIVECVR